MTTKQEAASKYCPQTMGDPQRYGCCLASACMAWRWGEHQPPRQRITCPDRYATIEEGMARPARALNWEFVPWADGAWADYPAQWLEPAAEYNTRREGYCGLAGKP